MPVTDRRALNPPARSPGVVHHPQRPQRSQRPQRPQHLRQATFIVICALTLALFVKSFVVQFFDVPSESMERTLLVGDAIAVTRTLTQFGPPHRGDVVVFRDPGGWLPRHVRNDGIPTQAMEFIGMIPYNSGEHLVKRVVGEAGDVLECRGTGPLYVNGRAANEPFLAPGSQPCDATFRIVVPARSIWVMGDNRNDSADSRFHLGDARHGSVPLSDVVGLAKARVWPPTRWGLLLGGS